MSNVKLVMYTYEKCQSYLLEKIKKQIGLLFEVGGALTPVDICVVKGIERVKHTWVMG